MKSSYWIASAVFSLSSLAWGDTGPKHDTCNASYIYGSAAQALFSSLNVPSQSEVSGQDKVVTKTFSGMDGLKTVTITCTQIYDPSGKTVGYSMGRRPACTIVREDLTPAPPAVFGPPSNSSGSPSDREMSTTDSGAAVGARVAD